MQDIPLRQRVGHREARLELRTDVRPVDAFDQRLELVGELGHLGEQRVRILGRLLALLGARGQRDPLAELLDPLLDVGSELECFGELHAPPS